MDVPVSEGYIPSHGHKTWYRIVGDGEEKNKVPLLCLHGGPGMTHDYLEPLEQIARTGRQVIFYDQLGCGNSNHPHEPSLWTMVYCVQISSQHCRHTKPVRKLSGMERAS